MLKFLFYLFLFYYLFRWLFGSISRSASNDSQTKNEASGFRPTSNGPSTKSSSSDSVGEYVDYEEVK